MKIINYRKSKNSDGYNYTKDGTVIKGEIQVTRDEWDTMLKKALADRRIEKLKYLGSGKHYYMTRDDLKLKTQNVNHHKSPHQ